MRIMNTNSKVKTNLAASKAMRLPKKRPTLGARIIEGLEQAIARAHGENTCVRVTSVHCGRSRRAGVTNLCKQTG